MRITLNHPKYGIVFKVLINEFETAMVNEPSVFEPLKFYCIYENFGSMAKLKDYGMMNLSVECNVTVRQ